LLVSEDFREIAGGKPAFFANAPDFVLGNQTPFRAPFAKLLLLDGAILLPFHPHHPLFRHGDSLIANRANR
jgi:hypothetical protein